MKKRIIGSLFISAIAFIMAFAVLCPSVDVGRIEPVGKPAYVINVSDVKSKNEKPDISISSNENFDYIIKCDVSDQQIKAVKITYENAAKTFTQTQIEFAQNTDFVDGSVTVLKRYEGDTQSCIDVDADFLRICSNEAIDNIALYQNAPEQTVKSLQPKGSRCIGVAVFTVFIFAAVFYIDKRLNVFEKFLFRIKDSKRRILFFIIGITTLLILSAAIEIIIRKLIGPDSTGQNFNMASFGSIAIILFTIFLFCFERKNIELRPERLTAMLILAVGALIILTEPFSHNSSDEDSHYYFAVQNSFYNEAYLTAADYNVRNTIGFSVAQSLNESVQNISVMNENALVSTYATPIDFKLTHRPAGTLIAVARLFGASFYGRFVAGQFGMLLVYATTVYFAIKKLKSGKMIMSIVAMCPTNILLASNYSYDPWVTGFSLLGIAYFISELQQPQKRITTCETIVMCGAFVLAALPKQVYCLLLILPMFMIKNWDSKKERQKYYALLIMFFAYIFISFVIGSLFEVTGSGDLRGGDVNPAKQIAYIFAHPINYAKMLLKFLFEYISPVNANKSINFFSYLGDGGSPLILVLLLAFCTLTDKNQYDNFKGVTKIKLIIIFVEFALICMIATALYISFTPLKSETINGCHPRYLMPLIAPLLLVLAPSHLAIKRRKATYNTAVMATMATYLIFKVLDVIVFSML